MKQPTLLNATQVQGLRLGSWLRFEDQDKLVRAVADSPGKVALSAYLQIPFVGTLYQGVRRRC